MAKPQTPRPASHGKPVTVGLGLRGGAALAMLVLANASSGAAAPPAAAPVTLAVDVSGALPGFRAQDLARYLAARMNDAHVEGWRFEASDGKSGEAPNRIEWKFRPNPFTGGSIRQIVPMPSVQRFLGAHRLVTAEARLYLDNAYETENFGQVAVDARSPDPELSGFVTKLTEALLGNAGAYRSITLAPTLPKKEPSHP